MSTAVAWSLAVMALAAPSLQPGTGVPAGAAPCIRLSRPGTQVQGDVRICPGRYRIADPSEHGVLIAAASGTRIDLAGVTIESGDSVPARFVGIGVASRGVDAVTVLGGTVRGFRFGVRLEGGRNHRLSGMELSGSRRQALRSRSDATDTLDRLDVARVEATEQYGAAILLRGTTAASVTGIIAHGSQTGLGLVESRDAYVADNDLADNSGWAVHLFRASRNTIVRNVASRTRRCPGPGGDCLAAAILVREGSDSNTIADNDLTGSSIGVLVTGLPPVGRPSVGNLVYRNDASLAAVAAFAARGTWGVSFVENRADSAAVGFDLVRLRASLVRGNTVIASRTAAVAITRGGDTEIEANVLLGGPVGIQAIAESGGSSRGVRIDDNMLSDLGQGMVLRGVIDSRVRGNVFDGVKDGLVIDGAGHATAVTGNVFLRASGWFIDAPDLVAGGNYWATGDAREASAKVRGRISVLPWMPASEAGY
jgi:nitrous oxidase accessory protein NosD